jgi:SAM-dependent methyltransferase
MTQAFGRLTAAGSGQHLGSVFAVTRHLALTCYHCVRDPDADRGVISRLRCAWPNETSTAVVQAWEEREDVALLRLTRPLPDTLDPLLLWSEVASNEPFVAPGAPEAMTELSLSAVSGLVVWPNAQMPGGNRGIELLCWPAVAGLSLHGLSGAPVLTGSMERVVGLIRWQSPDALHTELAAGGLVYAAPAGLILDLWPELSPAANLPELVRSLADRRRPRDREQLCSDVRRLLSASYLHLGADQLKVIPAPGGGPSSVIAIDIGQTVVSVESDLDDAAVLAVSQQELADAVGKRAIYADANYVAVLTDGAVWRLYHLRGRRLELIDTESADARAPGRLLDWLEAILGTGRDLAPSRAVIEEKLGSDSPSYKLDVAELRAIYEEHQESPTVYVKRRMWAKLLTTASGISFPDEDSLFIDHTLLVVTAKVIGHAVLGIQLDDPSLTAGELMSGDLFTQANITGVVESDFFDWLTEVPEGARFIMRLARRLSRFDWRAVEHDVLKHMYESIIPQATRHQLGEYYTPDWLASAIVGECVCDPLNQTVMDASCGSGTFLFHAIKSYLTAAESANKTTAEVISGLVAHVFGIDVHPVAVTLARITYLLAIGNSRLRRRPAFTVPVFLGDALRWGQEFDLLTYDYNGLSVSTHLEPSSFVTGPAAPAETGFTDQLNFPDRVVADTDRFDGLVARLAHLATAREQWSEPPSLADTFERFRIREDDQAVLGQTFGNMCRLHDEEQDHIWGYYVRNVARPAWLSRPANRVDVLVGNPPWLVYRSMTEQQQVSFRKMSVERGLWTGGTAAASQELAALFVSRCIELYLKSGGQFGYVMPWSILPRPGQQARGRHSGFRSGRLGARTDPVDVSFAQPWDLHGIKPSFFPLAVGVIFGSRQKTGASAVPMSERPRVMAGQFDTQRATWAEAQPSISILTGERWSRTQASPYAARFMAGATIFPRVLFFVESRPAPLGTVTGQRRIQSRRSPRERKPWRDLRKIDGSVEDGFIQPVLLGESILPFQCLEPLEAVIPWDGEQLLGDSDAQLGRYPGLGDWWHKAEAAWVKHRRGASQRLSLKQRLDYHHDLTRQFPIPQYRVVYTASGSYLAAATVTHPSAIVEHKLYWGSVACLEEARYLTAVLNSTVITNAVRPMQVRGENNPRDFDRYVFQLSIPLYDPGDAAHERLVVLAKRAERVVAVTRLPDVRFERQRGYIRGALEHDGVMADINALVKDLLL